MKKNNVLEAIAALDLNPIKTKLRHVASGEGWSQAKASAIELEYRRFLYLMHSFPNEEVAPTVDVDTFWHYHILDTMKYAADCEQAFGYFLHHYPYVGLDTAAEAGAEERGGQRMKELYELTFGEDYIRAEAYGTQEVLASDATAYCMLRTPAAAAYCMVRTPSQQSGTDAAYCMLRAPAKQAGAEAAYCMLRTPAKQAGADAAYCMLRTPAKQAGADTAYCMLRTPAKQAGADAAYCMLRTPAKQAGADAAYCMLRAPAVQAGADAAYCMLRTPAAAARAPVVPA